MNPSTLQPDPSLDLVLERFVNVSPHLVWRAWTEPELTKQWFTPAPWITEEVEMDLRPGGIFRTVMRGPEGESFDGSGCFLEVVPGKRLVWTSALGPGFRPTAPSSENVFFTAILTFEPEGQGTRYRAHLMHPDHETCARHNAMGFESGWGKALEQLVEVCQKLG